MKTKPSEVPVELNTNPADNIAAKSHKLKSYLFGMLGLLLGAAHAYEIVTCKVNINHENRTVGWALIPEDKKDLNDPLVRPKFISSFRRDKETPLEVWPPYPGIYQGKTIETIVVNLKNKCPNGISKFEFKKDRQIGNEWEWTLHTLVYNDVRQVFLQDYNEFFLGCSTEKLKFEEDGSNYKDLKDAVKKKIDSIKSEWDRVEDAVKPTKEKPDICSIS